MKLDIRDRLERNYAAALMRSVLFLTKVNPKTRRRKFRYTLTHVTDWTYSWEFSFFVDDEHTEVMSLDATSELTYLFEIFDGIERQFFKQRPSLDG